MERRVEEIEREFFGEVLDDEVREAAMIKNITDLRFYKWYIEHYAADESWEAMLQACAVYMNELEHRAETEDLDKPDQIALEGWRALRSGAFRIDEEPSE